MSALCKFSWLRRVFRFKKDEEGAATVEFVLVAPLFLGMVLATFESGWMMTQSMMLERGLDQVVRELRLGLTAVETPLRIQGKICEHTYIVHDCLENMELELVPIQHATDIPTSTKCKDRTAEVQPQVDFVPGSENEWMFIRACVIVDPIFPLIGLGLHLPLNQDNALALAAYAFLLTSLLKVRTMRVINQLRKFRDDTSATITVEFVIIAPVLLTLLALGFQFFDAFKSYSRAAKATYAVADIVSRQEDDIDGQFADKLHGLLEALLPWIQDDKSMRLTSIKWNVDESDYEVIWSCPINGNNLDLDTFYYQSQLTTENLSAEQKAMLPDLVPGDSVVFVETHIPYSALFDWIGLGDLVWENRVAIRPAICKRGRTRRRLLTPMARDFRSRG